jgi:hypothetical protein
MQENSITKILPVINPITFATKYFGGTLDSMCTFGPSLPGMNKAAKGVSKGQRKGVGS